jgi:sortase A
MTEYQPGDIQPRSDAAPLSRREARRAEAEAMKNGGGPSVPAETPSEAPDQTSPQGTAPTQTFPVTPGESEVARPENSADGSQGFERLGLLAEEPAAQTAVATRSRRSTKQRKPAGPPPPRSIGTRIIGVFGELFITAGVLVLLFLGWQLWWNSIVLTNEQQSNANTLADDWKTTAPTASDTATPTPTPTTTDAAAAPVNYGEPAVMESPAAASDFAILYVPRFGADFKRTVGEGVDPHAVLNKGGAGHYEDSQMPGEVGNFAVAAHRDGWGSAFIKINELQIGDPIYVETQDGWYTYRYRDTEYVTPYGVGVIEPVPQVEGATPADRLITLTSCNPLYIASERIIAYGVFESWQPRSAGPPAEIASVVGSGN